MRLSPYNQKILAGLVATLIPVGYLVGLHVKWMQDTPERVRMALKHAGFWGGMTLSLVGLHKFIIQKRNPLMKDVAIAVGLSLLPILGYEALRRLAKKWFPSTNPMPVMLHDPLSQPEQPAPPKLDIDLPPSAPVQLPQLPKPVMLQPQPAYSYPAYPYYGWYPYPSQMGMTRLGGGYTGRVTHV